MSVKTWVNKYTVIGAVLGALLWPRVRGKINMPG